MLWKNSAYVSQPKLNSEDFRQTFSIILLHEHTEMGLKAQSYLQADPSKISVKTSRGKWYHSLCLGSLAVKIRLKSQETVHSSGRSYQWVLNRRHRQLLIPERYTERQEDFNHQFNTSGKEKRRLCLCNGHEQNHVNFTQAFNQSFIDGFKIYRRNAQNYLL